MINVGVFEIDKAITYKLVDFDENN